MDTSSSTTQVPIQTNQPFFHHHHHHHRTRFIRDSLHRRCMKLFCSLFLSLLFLALFILFLLFLILRPHRPRFHVSSLSLNPHSSSSFNLSIRNPNRQIGIFYDNMLGSLFYKSNEVAVFEKVMAPFYQMPKNTKVVLGAAPVQVSEEVAAEIEADGAQGAVGVRLELRTVVRFRVTIWDTHRHRMHVSCELEVGGDGNLLREYKDKRCSIYFL